MKKFRLLLLLAILAPIAGFGQRCKGVQYECIGLAAQEKGKGSEKGQPVWSVTGQSKYGSFAFGDTTEVSITVFKNVNYRITFCALDAEIKGKIIFQVVEREAKAETVEKVVTKTRQKEDANGQLMFDADGNTITETYTETVKTRVYGKVPVVRYDNTKDNNKQWVEFTTDKDRNLIVKVLVPVVGEKSKNDLAPQGMVCIGMLVEQQQGASSGGWK
jgi:hypothetical protein